MEPDAFDFDIAQVRAAVDAVKSKEMREIGESLYSNMEMIEKLCGLPDMIAAYAALTASRAERIRPLTEEYVTRVNQEAPLQPSEQLQQYKKSLIGEFQSKALALHREFHSSEAANQAIEQATDALREGEWAASPELRTGLRALFGGAIILAWTTFECLATDLWERALNLSPVSLASRAANAVDTADGGSKSNPVGLSARWISIDVLRKYGFDLRCHMGSVLKSKFTFSDLNDLRRAYAAAFGKDKALEGIFDADELRLLVAVRNLLVHRAGIVDARFKERVVRHEPKMAALKEGEVFIAMGEWPTRLVRAGIAGSCSLMLYVDGWITKNSAPDASE